MADWLILGLFAFGFYLYECCTWTPATVFACCRKPLRRGWAAVSGDELPGNDAGGFALADPATLSGAVIHCSEWPVAISPEGVALDTVDATEFWAFETVQSVSAYEKTVRFNGTTAFRAGSESLAHDLVKHLDRLRELQPKRRADAIRAALDRSFDTAALNAEWSQYRIAVRGLARLCALPLAWLIVIAPVVLIVAGPLASWPYLLGGLLLAGLTVAMEFARVQRRELPHVSDRWLHAVSMTLFPIAAVRAADRISKERLAQFSPFAIAAVFCDAAAADALLRRAGFDLDQAASAADTPAANCRRWYHEQKRRSFRGLLEALRRDPFAAPEPVDEGMAAYCPRCHSQFQQGTSCCSDCEDLGLIAFAERG